MGSFDLPERIDELANDNKVPVTGMNLIEPLQPEDQHFKVASNAANFGSSSNAIQRNSVDRLNIDFNFQGQRDRMSTKKTIG